MATKTGICWKCDAYVDLRTVLLKNGRYGYKCTVCGHTFSPNGTPQEEAQ